MYLNRINMGLMDDQTFSTEPDRRSESWSLRSVHVPHHGLHFRSGESFEELVLQSDSWGLNGPVWCLKLEMWAFAFADHLFEIGLTVDRLGFPDFAISGGLDKERLTT
jgi:hypothetical protein